MASEVQQIMVIILGQVPNRVDQKEASAAERLVRVRHLTVARAAELMEFVIEHPDIREQVHSVRDFERHLKNISAAYEAERQEKQRHRRPVPRDLSELERLEAIGRRGAETAGERPDWLRDRIAELRAERLSGPEYRLRLKQLLQTLIDSRKDAA